MRTIQDAMALMFERGKANMTAEDLDGLAGMADVGDRATYEVNRRKQEVKP